MVVISLMVVWVLERELWGWEYVQRSGYVVAGCFTNPACAVPIAAALNDLDPLFTPADIEILTTLFDLLVYYAHHLSAGWCAFAVDFDHGGVLLVSSLVSTYYSHECGSVYTRMWCR